MKVKDAALIISILLFFIRSIQCLEFTQVTILLMTHNNDWSFCVGKLCVYKYLFLNSYTYMHHIRPLENPEYVSVTEWKFCQYLTTPHRKKKC